MVDVAAVDLGIEVRKPIPPRIPDINNLALSLDDGKKDFLDGILNHNPSKGYFGSGGSRLPRTS